MKSIVAIFFILSIACVRSSPVTGANLFVLYSNSDNNILVKDLGSGTTVKTFTVLVKNPSFIVMDYDNDALFFTDDKTVYRIYLVDDNGDRKISGKGELFTNPLADHIETTFYTLPSFRNVKGFIFDRADRMLYLMSPYYKDLGDYFMKLDAHDGKLSMSGRIQFTASSYVLHNRMLYAASHNKGCSHLSSITLDQLNREGEWKWIEKAKCWTPDAMFTVDSITNRMFFIEDKHTIRLLDGDLTRDTVSAMIDRYVISDSEVTKDVKGISVYGNVVVWSSGAWEKLYVGFLNKKVSFMSKQNVRVLDVKHSGFANIVIFKNAEELNGNYEEKLLTAV